MRDPSVEKWLSDHGATFDYVEKVSLEKIDTETSLHNQARVFESIDDDQVILYAEAMVHGDEFPPLVVYSRSRTARYLVIDGNHRLKAYDLADKKTVSAYVVKSPSDAQIAALTYEANTRHGKPTSLKERLIQGVWLVDRGAEMATASRILGVPERQLVYEVGKQRAVARLAKLGLGRMSQGIPDTAKKRLGNIRNDKVLMKATELVHQAGMSGPMVSEMVTRINAVNTEADQLNEVEQFKRRVSDVIAATAGDRIPLPKELNRLSKLVQQTATINLNALRRSLQTTEGSIPKDLKNKLISQLKKMQNTTNKAIEILSGPEDAQ